MKQTTGPIHRKYLLKLYRTLMTIILKIRFDELMLRPKFFGNFKSNSYKNFCFTSGKAYSNLGFKIFISVKKMVGGVHNLSYYFLW